MDQEIKSLYVDRPVWENSIEMDDFLITIGKTKSNSVYHVVEVRTVIKPEKRIVRYYVKVLKSDLMTALKRDISQQLIAVEWYKR